MDSGLCFGDSGLTARSRGLTRKVVIDLKTTLRTWLRTLSGEQKKSEKELDSEKKAVEDNPKKAEANAAQLLKKKSVQGEELKHLRSLADKLLNQGKQPTLADLPVESRLAIGEVSRVAFGICGRCRWKFGCLSCSVKHAERYYLGLSGPCCSEGVSSRLNVSPCMCRTSLASVACSILVVSLQNKSLHKQLALHSTEHCIVIYIILHCVFSAQNSAVARD